MSAANCYVQPDGAVGYLLTDSLATATTDAMVASNYISKTITLPHALTAMTCRGDASGLAIPWLLSGRLDSFDEISAEFQTLLSGAWGTPDTKPFRAMFEYTCVGWSESSKRVKAFCSAGSEDFVPRWNDLIIAPAIGLDRVPLFDFAGELDFFHPARALVRIMSAQRDRARHSQEPGERGVIGGHAVLTTVTREAIEQRVTHRWADAPAKLAEAPAPKRRLISMQELAILNAGG